MRNVLGPLNNCIAAAAGIQFLDSAAGLATSKTSHILKWGFCAYQVHLPNISDV